MTIISPWAPCQIGDVDLQHRVVLAPLTRGRASPSSVHANTWIANDLMKQYYSERATNGGLLIAEAGPVSLRASGLPGIPGWFTDEQVEAWSSIIRAVHSKGGRFFAQLWHQGRNTHSSLIGRLPESSSAVSLTGSLYWSGLQPLTFESPQAMSPMDISATQQDFVLAAQRAISAGCDGIEIHAGNGYLFDQFHHSNINQRVDRYGGSIEDRCRFTIETVDKLCDTIGAGRVAVRLSPFGLFNETFGEDRVQQWTYLCQELAKRRLAYVHMIEPRFDEFKSAMEKASALGDMGVSTEVSLVPFRTALGSTKLLAAGGFGPDNFEEGIQDGSHDMVAFGRYFIANPDLIERLKANEPLYKWDRSTFYGPFNDNEVGYTVHPTREIAGKGDRLKGQLAE